MASLVLFVLSGASTILHRVLRLAVQGANGIQVYNRASFHAILETAEPKVLEWILPIYHAHPHRLLVSSILPIGSLGIMVLSLANLACALLFTSVVGAVHALVTLPYASYLGTAQPNNVTSWLGLRFAAPPLGSLRFAAPQEPDIISGIQIADTHGLLCLSTGASPTDNTTSEDCLFLDVYAPSTASSECPLPVYFFIQGGGFNTDSNANYRGDGLIIASEMNIVVVNFNYRVGPYGFLASQEVVSGGALNAGLLDQRMALEWVQKYILQFGGDPNHVTIGGDSAGAASVAFHLTAYSGNPPTTLFHAAAAESVSFGPVFTVSESQYQYDGLVSRAGCSNASDTLECLRGVSAQDLQSVNYNLPNPRGGQGAGVPLYMYNPVIDGTLIPDLTYRSIQEGKFVKVPAIFGDDTNGGTIFTPQNTSTYPELDRFLSDQFPALTPYQIMIINTFYPPAEQFNGTGELWRAVSNAYGEIRYMCPGIATSSAFAAYSGEGIWTYRYNVEDPTDLEEGYGVPHTAELAAIWGPSYLPSASPASYYNTNAPIIPIMQGYWTSFIRTYNPNTYLAAGAPVWEEWTAEGMDRLMVQTNATAMETVALDMQGRCEYLDTIAIALQQ